MEHEVLTEDMVTGYRAYAVPADLEVSATVEAPATTPYCIPVYTPALSYVPTVIGPR